MHRYVGWLSLLASAVLVAGTVSAQETRARGRMAGDREAFRERLRETLKASEEEWSLIEPLMEKVQQMQRAARWQRMGGRGGAAPEGETSPVQQAAEALQATLDAGNAAPALIRERLDGLRAARQAQEQALREAREALRAVLTPEQEARLVLRGMLD